MRQREAGFTEYYAAIDADNAWQTALDAAGIDRYSMASHGADGSELRRLWVAKTTADALRFDANCLGCQECRKGH